MRTVDASRTLLHKQYFLGWKSARNNLKGSHCVQLIHSSLKATLFYSFPFINSFIYSLLSPTSTHQHTGYHDMDCLSLPDNGQYNCTNLWGTNCINAIGFDFDTMWEITQRIQQYCPTDSRLFLIDNIPATESNAALTGPACKAFAGSIWQFYPAADTWVRLTTWKFPLLQLVASSPRPPLGFAVEGFVILHLLGDPVGTIKDLLRVVSSCQKHADYWRAYLAKPQPGMWQLSSVQIGHVWKSFTIISISYDEWGKGEDVKIILKNSL